MPPDTWLPSSVLAALGLLACTGSKVGPCLTDTTGCLCLDNCAPTDDETDADTDADGDSDTDTDTDTDTHSGHSGGSHSGAAAAAGASPVLDRLDGVLPSDVMERLRAR